MGSHFAEFAHFRNGLKPYHNIIPIKIVKSNDLNTPPFTVEPETVHVYTGNPFYPTAVAERDGNLYYYKPGGFGEIGNWFQYGIPKGRQVSLK